MASKPIMLMGKGSGRKELEHCPPVEHFELTEEELAFALKDPASVARKLGLDTPEAIHVRGPSAPSDADAAPAAEREADDRAPAADEADAPGATYCCVRCLSNSWCCTAWPGGSLNIPSTTELRVLPE
jgi:hypothetical protein